MPYILKTFVKVFYILTLTLSGVLISGCSFFKASSPVVLQIASQKWTSQEFTNLLKQKMQHLSISGSINKETLEHTKEQLIKDLLVKQIIKQWAKKNNLTVSKKKLAKEIKKIKESYSDPSIFEMYLIRKKINQKKWESSVRDYLLTQKVIQKIGSNVSPPNKKEIETFYQNHLLDFKKKALIKIRHIFHIKKEPLLKVLQLLKTGKKFKTLARQFSQAPYREKPQWVEKGISTVFDKAFNLKQNQISPIWSDTHGWHIIQVLNKIPTQTLSLKEAQPIITSLLIKQRQKARWTKWLDKQGHHIVFIKDKELIKNINIL